MCQLNPRTEIWAQKQVSTQFQCDPLLEKWDWATPSMSYTFTNPCIVAGHPLMSICPASTLTISVWNLHKTDSHFCSPVPSVFKTVYTRTIPGWMRIITGVGGNNQQSPKPWTGTRAILTQQQKPSQATALVNPFWAWDFLRSGTQWTPSAAVVQAYWWFLKETSQNLKLH